jgi:hypothetical protein
VTMARNATAVTATRLARMIGSFGVGRPTTA